MATITCKDVTKLFGDGTPAVANLNLEVMEGELLVLVGPSGCGKSTTLRMVAGLEQISSGTIWIGDRLVNDLPPRARDVALVFQNYSLYPHMTVAQNMGFPLKLKRTPREQVRARVDEAARILGLEELLNRKPGTLSGGERQRVAMGRAIVREPQAFLMDEPLSNLDAQLRTHMRTEIVALQQRLAITTLYVTHDQVEAMTMGHRVAVLNRGVLQQLDTPQALYDRPDNLFVAEFIGSPAMNLLTGTLTRRNGTITLALGEQELALDGETLGRYPAARTAEGPIAVGIRPEHLSRPEPGTPAERCLQGTVTLTEALGSDLIVHCRVQAPRVESELVRAATGRNEDVLQNGAGGTIVVARLEPGDTLGHGEPIRLAVKHERLHFFELESGRALH